MALSSRRDGPLGRLENRFNPRGVQTRRAGFLLMPCGATLATGLGILKLGPNGVTWFHSLYIPYLVIAPGFLGALVGYYLLWKYVVGFLNRTLGIV